MPWVHGVKQRYQSQGLVVIGVESPYDAEKLNHAHIAAVVKDYGMDDVIYIDPDMAFINAIGAEYHPTFVLVDKQGRVRLGEFGSKFADTDDARKFEAQIEALLKE